METKTQSQITVRLFLAFQVSATFKQHIYNNALWEESLIAWQSSSSGLKKILHEGKEFMGCSIDEEGPSLKALAELRETICQTIEGPCPDFDSENLKFYVIPQLFIS